MPRVARPKTLQDFRRADAFLERAGDTSLHSVPALVGFKRDALADHFGASSRLRPYEASERQINTVFSTDYKRCRDIVDRYKADPLPFLFHEELERPTDDLAERIAIMLDCYTEDPRKLADLTTMYGADSLGDYARRDRSQVAV